MSLHRACIRGTREQPSRGKPCSSTILLELRDWGRTLWGTGLQTLPSPGPRLEQLRWDTAQIFWGWGCKVPQMCCSLSPRLPSVSWNQKVPRWGANIRKSSIQASWSPGLTRCPCGLGLKGRSKWSQDGVGYGPRTWGAQLQEFWGRLHTSQLI